MTDTSTEPSPIIFEDDNKEVIYKQEGEVNKETWKRDLLLPPLT